jgi:adenosylhomocysteine nucleosidase
MSPKILAVTGLTKEARIAAGPGILAIAGGGSRAGLERQLAAADLASIRAVVSFGIAGALDPARQVGDVLIATEIRSADASCPTATAFQKQWAERLRGAGVPFVACAVAGTDEPLLTPAAKQTAFRRYAADAVDMESHVAAAA